MSLQGVCKSFNGAKGWGFIDFGGTDIFVHIKDCLGDRQPAKGDVLSFDMEQNKNKPGQMQAKNVLGGSAPREPLGGCGGVGGCGGMPGMMPATMTGTEGLVAGVAGVEGFPSVVAAAAPLPTPGAVLPSGVRHQGVVKAWNTEKGFGFVNVRS
eukprot:g18025.t1